MKRVNIKETDNRDSSETDLILDNGINTTFNNKLT